MIKFLIKLLGRKRFITPVSWLKKDEVIALGYRIYINEELWYNICRKEMRYERDNNLHKRIHTDKRKS